MNDKLTKIRAKYAGPPVTTIPTATGHMLVGMNDAREWANTDEGKVCIDFAVVFDEMDNLQTEYERADSMLHEKADQIFVLESTIRQQQKVIALFLNRCNGSAHFAGVELMDLPRDTEIHSRHADDGGIELSLRKPTE